MKRIITAAALLLVAFAAGAQEEGEDHPRFRFGFAAAFSDYQGDSTFNVSDSSLGLELYAQGQINRHFAIEGGYYASGGFETNLSPGVPSNLCTPEDFCDVELSLNGFTLAGVGYLPLGGEEGDIDLYAKLGGYDFDIDMTQRVGNTRVPGSLGHSTGFTAGLGAIIDVGENFGVRVGFDYFDIENADLWTLAMGLEYQF
jgi:opacity protein-like surface antigen